MITDEFSKSVMDLFPDFARHYRFERRRRKRDSEVTRPAMAGVDNLAPGLGSPSQKMRDVLDRLLRRRQAHPQQAIAAKGRQALEGEREMRAALVWRQGVDFIDDHGPGRCQDGTAGVRGQQNVKQFRRGDENVRRAPAHLCALALRRVAGAHQGADFDIGQATLAQGLADTGKGFFEVFLDVVRQRFQGRDIDDLRRVLEAAFEPLPHEAVDGREESGQGLA